MAVDDGRMLDGKVVAVTGGGRGVGRAHALACARAGARVLVVDTGGDVHGQGRDPSVAEAVAAQIRGDGGVAHAAPIDVAGPAGPARVVGAALDAEGRLDALISAAGVVAARTVLKLDDDLLDRAIAVHIKASFGLVRAAARAMIERGDGGSIVLHSGAAAFFGAAKQAALAATSAAVVGLTRSAAIELRKHRVRVNAIAPTARTRTTEELPLFRGIADDSMTPAFVGPVGVFLASDRAADVTGEVVGVAGARLYALGSRETPGVFGPGEPWSPAAVAEAWAEATRD
ncbi:MAG: SDR family NAD(P)-dependent oxidoreductase [Sandaracinaceae bacterium]